VSRPASYTLPLGIKLCLGRMQALHARCGYLSTIAKIQHASRFQTLFIVCYLQMVFADDRTLELSPQGIAVFYTHQEPAP
jgi:hypothetical protein